ncbi:unnamed protein product [Amoebophrya sp. A120]|nr:unnamed protein product [Amoebophrya sp. A120]|eukprot:GSA120T00011496001.1
MAQLLNLKGGALNLGAVKQGLTTGLDQGLSFMKQKINEVAKHTRQAGYDSDDDPPTIEPTNPGEQLVRYFIQGGNPQVPDDEDNMFTLPALPYYTKAVVLQDFPLRGEFHFRFKQPDDEFGFIWVDVPDLEDLVPCYQGMIQLKVLSLPVPSPEYARVSSVARPVDSRGSRGQFSPSQRRQQPVETGVQPSKPVANPDLLIGTGPASASSSFGSVQSYASGPTANQRGHGGNHFAKNDLESLGPVVKAEDLDRDKLVREREEEKAARMREKLEKHNAAREKEESGKQERAEAGQELKTEMDNWCMNPQDGKCRDVRTLLASLQDVIWEGSTWHPVSLGDLMLNPSRVKKCWQKAILISHPDRHNDADGRRRYRAERIFEAINESYKSFKP